MFAGVHHGVDGGGDQGQLVFGEPGDGVLGVEVLLLEEEGSHGGDLGGRRNTLAFSWFMTARKDSTASSKELAVISWRYFSASVLLWLSAERRISMTESSWKFISF